jgi:hypothetical protein
MATKRPEVVTLEGLSASLDKAFAVASKRHGAEFEEGTVALNWEIFGRRIKSLKQDNASRLDVANTVVSAMKLKDVQPAVIGFNKWILVGFWDPLIRDIRTGLPR